MCSLGFGHPVYLRGGKFYKKQIFTTTMGSFFSGCTENSFTESSKIMLVSLKCVFCHELSNCYTCNNETLPKVRMPGTLMYVTPFTSPVTCSVRT